MGNGFGAPITESVILGNIDEITGLGGVRKALKDAKKLPLTAVLNITAKIETAAHRPCFPARKREQAIDAARQYRIAAMTKR